MQICKTLTRVQLYIIMTVLTVNGGNEGEAAGVATQIVVMWVWWIGSAWGQHGVSMGMGSYSVVDETLGMSRHRGWE
jgi:hypothetical protein